MRWKFEREDFDEYRCCLCFHVRTGTLLLGLLNLICLAAGFTWLVIGIIHPDMMDTMLPPRDHAGSTLDLLSEKVNVTALNWKLESRSRNTDNLQAWTHVKNWNFESMVSAMLLTAIFMMIAAYMVYGTVKGVAKYLTPFFCVQMFDFCLSGLTMLSYFSNVTSVRRWISDQSNLPFKKELLALDADHLTLLTLIVFILVLTMKGYFIGMVWSCYKYLRMREMMNAQNRIHVYDIEEIGIPDDAAQALLPPKYEDILSMPATQNGPAPPPYSTQ